MDFLVNAAIQYLSDRNMSEKELRVKLYDDFKETTDFKKLIEPAIVRLKKLELINDLRVASSLTHRFSHKGNNFIRHALEQKGISENLILQVLEGLDDESVRAQEEARKRLQSLDKKRNKDTKSLLERFLSGRGFSFLAIESALAN